MRRLSWICALGLAAGLVGACGDDLPGKPGDAGLDHDAAPDGPAPQGLASCVDRPTDLPRPPTTGLSCDLLPPGLAVMP